MTISGIGSNAIYPGMFAGGASGANAAGTSSAVQTSAQISAQTPAGGSNSALQFLTDYLKESPAKRMEDAWLAKHHLTEQQLAAMPSAQQDAIRKQMADDIKKKLQEQSGGAGTNVNITA
jgi:hypothetical protein